MKRLLVAILLIILNTNSHARKSLEETLRYYFENLPVLHSENDILNFVEKDSLKYKVIKEYDSIGNANLLLVKVGRKYFYFDNLTSINLGDSLNFSARTIIFSTYDF